MEQEQIVKKLRGRPAGKYGKYKSRQVKPIEEVKAEVKENCN